MFWIILFSRLIFYKDEVDYSKDSVSTTILIVFKNALGDIKQCVSRLTNQNIETLNILLVDDFSNDGGETIAKGLSGDQIKYYKATIDEKGKKLALQEGINIVDTEAVLLTDIDCAPSSDSWVRIMQSKFRENTEIVLGYSPMIKKPGLVNVFSRFETWMTAVQYMSYALARIPYMGVGRNLAYRKSIAVGYVPNTSIASGDDDMFVSAKANARNTTICLDPDSFVMTQAKSSWREFINQKRRHISSSHYYSLIHKVLLSVFAMSQMIIYPCLILLLCLGEVQGSLLLNICIFLMLKWIIASQVMKKFEESSLTFWFPFMDVLLSAYYWLMALLSLKPLKTWS